MELSAVEIGATATTLCGVVTTLWLALDKSYAGRLADKDKQLADKDREIASLRETADNWHGLAARGAENLFQINNQKRIERGDEPLPPLAPVIARHNSPTTQAQEDVADFQTSLAKLAVAAVGLGLPPEKTPEPPNQPKPPIPEPPANENRN